MYIPFQFLYSDEKLNWVQDFKLLLFFFSSVNTLRSGHHKKERILPSLIVTISGHDSCAWN